MGMPISNKCCCCSLKLGCKIIGALAIIDHGYKVTQSMTEIVEENIKSDDQKNQEIEDLIEGMDVLGISLNKSSVEQWLFHVYITAFIDVIFSMIGLISYGCLWFGVFKEGSSFSFQLWSSYHLSFSSVLLHQLSLLIILASPIPSASSLNPSSSSIFLFCFQSG